MTAKAAILAVAFACALAGAGLVSARDPQSEGGAIAEQLMAQALADDPSKEVTAQVYTFPPGTVLPWHIHPDAHEIAYVLEGTFTFERAGEPPKEIAAGEADYLAPNVVPPGMTKTDNPVRLFVVPLQPH